MERLTLTGFVEQETWKPDTVLNLWLEETPFSSPRSFESVWIATELKTL